MGLLKIRGAQMVKKNTSMWIEPQAQRGIKFLSFKFDHAAGDIIESLLQFPMAGERIANLCRERGITDPKTIETFREIFSRLFLMAMHGELDSELSDDAFIMLLHDIQETIGRRAYAAAEMDYEDDKAGDQVMPNVLPPEKITIKVPKDKK
jgi:hypothetical protein